MKITSQIFLSHLKCNTKCWFWSLGKTGTGNAYTDWVKTRNDTHRSEGIKRLIEKTTHAEYAFRLSAEDLKRGRWRLAKDLVLESDFRLGGGSYKHNTFISSYMKIARPENPPAFQSRIVLATNLQAVERLPSENRGG